MDAGADTQQGLVKNSGYSFNVPVTSHSLYNCQSLQYGFYVLPHILPPALLERLSCWFPVLFCSDYPCLLEVSTSSPFLIFCLDFSVEERLLTFRYSLSQLLHVFLLSAQSLCTMNAPPPKKKQPEMGAW